jgi:hypothetical protein
VGAAVETDAPVTIKGMTEAVFTPRLPAGWSPSRCPTNATSWPRTPPSTDIACCWRPRRRWRSLPHLALAGVTLAPESIGLPAAPVAELQKALPNVDPRFVTALLWSWDEAAEPGQITAALLGALGLGVRGGGGLAGGAGAAAADGLAARRAPSRDRTRPSPRLDVDGKAGGLQRPPMSGPQALGRRAAARAWARP